MLNMDFSKRLVIETDPMEWVASPAKGVWRKPLEREAKESGHTTSVVKYDPESSFSEHPHPKGEEIFVLEGVFSDETGDFSAGTYIRNPPGSAHSPSSKNGCTILVKLNQFDDRDLAQVRVDTNQTEWLPGIGGLQVMPLHEFEHEHVALVKCLLANVFSRIVILVVKRFSYYLVLFKMNMVCIQNTLGCVAHI